MDLGATVCTPKSPACDICPWADQCEGRRQGLAASLPRKTTKKPLPTRKGYAYLAQREDGAILLRRRPEKGLLGGMMEVPGTQWQEALPRSYDALAPFPANWRRVPGLVEHTFTHFRLEITVLSARVKNGHPPAGGRWVLNSEVGKEALPSVMRKILSRLPPRPE
jgi:A/G-specific adenine glycosylase